MKTGRAARPRGRAFGLGVVAVLPVLAALAWAFNPGPRWRVADTQRADGNVLFDGDPVPAADTEAMGDLLLGGTTIEWRGHGDLELISPGHAVLAIAPGTVLRLPAPPPRFFARTSTSRLHEGTLRFLPGPGFAGARLVIETPARSFTAAAGGPVEIAHDPARGTRVVATGAALDAFARTRGPLLAGRPAP
jgi:hypothetical protein